MKADLDYLAGVFDARGTVETQVNGRTRLRIRVESKKKIFSTLFSEAFDGKIHAAQPTAQLKSGDIPGLQWRCQIEGENAVRTAKILLDKCKIKRDELLELVLTGDPGFPWKRSTHEISIQYIAGLFDAKGSIYYLTNNKKPAISISSQEKFVVELFQNRFGGRIHSTNPGYLTKSGKKSISSWDLSRKEDIVSFGKAIINECYDKRADLIDAIMRASF